MSQYGFHGSSITFDLTTSTYHVNFAGKIIKTTVTDKSSVANQWVTEILSIYATTPMVVGLDVEWKPHHISGMTNKSATLQLCIGNRCLILQLFYMDAFPQSLKQFLMDPNFTFVGIEVGDDINKINTEYGLECNKRADIRDVAIRKFPRRPWYRGAGLKSIALSICGLHMEKPLNVCRSDWDARVLSERQVEYACIDAYASFSVGLELLIE